MVVNVTKVSQNTKNKRLLKIKKYYRMRESVYIILSGICNYYSVKESLKIRKTNDKKGNFM